MSLFRRITSYRLSVEKGILHSLALHKSVVHRGELMFPPWLFEVGKIKHIKRKRDFVSCAEKCSVSHSLLKGTNWHDLGALVSHEMTPRKC